MTARALPSARSETLGCWVLTASAVACLLSSMTAPVGGWTSGAGVLAEVARLLGISMMAVLVHNRSPQHRPVRLITLGVFGCWWAVVALGVWAFWAR